jgi:hypothetical protein
MGGEIKAAALNSDNALAGMHRQYVEDVVKIGSPAGLRFSIMAKTLNYAADPSEFFLLRDGSLHVRAHKNQPFLI